MTVYTRPPQLTPELWKELGPMAFNPNVVSAEIATMLLLGEEEFNRLQEAEPVEEKRTAFGLKLLFESMKVLTWETGNGVLLVGPAGSGKSTLGVELQRELRHMHHTPEERLMRTDYNISPDSFPERCDHPLDSYLSGLKGYVYSRVLGIIDMQKNIESKSHSTDEIIIGGIIQSFVTLCAYCHAYSVNETNGMLQIPDSIMATILLMMKQWAPRFIVYVDAPLEERENRAEKQLDVDENSVIKRGMPFSHDQILRELTLTTALRMKSFARIHGNQLHFAYYPNSMNCKRNIDGFVTVFSLESLGYFIERRQEHPQQVDLEKEFMLSRRDDTWGDEGAGFW